MKPNTLFTSSPNPIGLTIFALTSCFVMSSLYAQTSVSQANPDFINGSARNGGYWVREQVRALPTPQAGRITDSAIHQDYLAYEAQQANINATNAVQNPYATAKAQCWLDVSFQEYTRNDRSSFVEEAFLESKKITDALRSGSGSASGVAPWTLTPLVNKATNAPSPIAKQWQRASALTAAQRNCKPAQSACAEVELVHAGNEWNQGGQTHAEPYLVSADRYLTQAEQSNCAPVSAPAPVPVVAPIAAKPTMPVVEPKPVVLAPLAAIPQRVHFPFDQDYIAPGTNQVLDQVAKALKANPAIKLMATGHTDVRATDRYNLDLSMRRVANVQAYLKAAGIMPGQVQLGGAQNNLAMAGAAGKTQIDKLGAVEQAHQYNRRVEFSLAPGSAPAQLQAQFADLHPCGDLNHYWCDNPKRQSGTKIPAEALEKMRQEKVQIQALMKKLQAQK